MGKKYKIDFDLLKFWKLFKADKKTLAIYIGISIIVGLIVAFSIPKRYKANIELAPETSSNNMLSSISSLASMVGLYSDANPNGDAIYPEIYPDMMSSNEFIVSLFDIKVTSIDGEINTSYYNYLKKHQKITWWSIPAAWVALQITKLMQDDFNGKSAEDKINPFRLTRKQYGLVSAVRNAMKCYVDKKTNVINIEFEAQDPLIAATMADSVKNRLQSFITRYRTNKARTDLEYMEKLFAESQNDYNEARKRYATFSDANNDVILYSVSSKREDLENDMQLKYNIYTQVAQQLQLAKAKLQESTPAFTVIQAVSVPIKSSNFKKIYILILFMILGFATRIVVLALKNKDSLFSYNS